MGDEYRENLKQQLQVEAQRLRYEDELARKRIQVFKLPPVTIFINVFVGVFSLWCLQFIGSTSAHDLIRHLF